MLESVFTPLPPAPIDYRKESAYHAVIDAVTETAKRMVWSTPTEAALAVVAAIQAGNKALDATEG